MPRLSDPLITKGIARWTLLKLYMNNREFMKELNGLRRPYTGLIDTFANDCLALVLDEDTPSDLPKVFFNYATGKSSDNPFPPELFYQVFPYFDRLQPYFDGLDKLANKWKLRASWAWLLLFFYDIVECCKAKGVPTEFGADAPLERFASLCPWEPPVPPLTITVPAWASILLGRKGVLQRIAKKVEEYENQIREAGLKEYPSALEIHAQWWFMRYVKDEPYDEIAQMETYTPNGSLISYARNVGSAVIRFSRRIGIDPRVLK